MWINYPKDQVAQEFPQDFQGMKTQTLQEDIQAICLEKTLFIYTLFLVLISGTKIKCIT